MLLSEYLTCYSLSFVDALFVAYYPPRYVCVGLHLPRMQLFVLTVVRVDPRHVAENFLISRG